MSTSRFPCPNLLRNLHLSAPRCCIPSSNLVRRSARRAFGKCSKSALHRPSLITTSEFRSSYWPWAANFKGSRRTATVLQSFCYGALLAYAYDFSRTKNDEPEMNHDLTNQAAEPAASELRDAYAAVAALQQVLKRMTAGQKPSVPSYATREELQEAITTLKQLFPDEGSVICDPTALLESGASYSAYLPDIPHAVVVRPRSTADVVKIVQTSRKFKVPIVAAGGATAFEGQFVGHPSGSICIDMSRMDKILAINVKDEDLVCQAGSRWEDINEHLEDEGVPLFFPLDSGPSATIGGMMSTACSGTNSTKYGDARAGHFLNATVVLPSGEVIKTRRRARKSATGFDTTSLFVGGEGTLGIVTEVTVRLAPVMPHTVAIAQFPNTDAASAAIREIMASPYGNQLQSIELLDRNTVAAISIAKAVPNSLPAHDTLLFKVQGDAELIRSSSAVMNEIASKHSCIRFELAASQRQAEDMWKLRKHILISTAVAHPKSQCWMTDVCVPPSKAAALIEETKADLENQGLKSVTFGRLGEGSFHTLVLFNGREQYQTAADAVKRLEERAISMDGSCSGEHGIGISKKQYLEDELGVNTVALMRTIKNTLDPYNLFNPGKLYPSDVTLLSCRPTSSLPVSSIGESSKLDEPDSKGTAPS